MNTKRRNAMMWRFSLSTSILIGLFWLVYYLVKGYVPTISVVEIGYWNIELPFAISRWADMAIGPIGSVILIWLYTKTIDDKGLRSSMLTGLLLGLLFGLGAGLTPPDPISHLVFGFLVGLVIILLSGLSFGLTGALVLAQGYLTLFSLTTGLFQGFSYSLVIGLVFGLTYSLVFGLVFGFKPGTRRLKNWLLVKDQD